MVWGGPQPRTRAGRVADVPTSRIPNQSWASAKAKAKIFATLYNFLHILLAHMSWLNRDTVVSLSVILFMNLMYNFS